MQMVANNQGPGMGKGWGGNIVVVLGSVGRKKMDWIGPESRISKRESDSSDV